MLKNLSLLKENFLSDLQKMESWYFKEYEYSRSSGWSGFSSAKGEYRLIRGYLDAVSKTDLQRFASMDALIEFFRKLAYEIPYDTDYPEPVGARKRILDHLDEIRKNTNP